MRIPTLALLAGALAMGSARADAALYEFSFTGTAQVAINGMAIGNEVVKLSGVADESAVQAGISGPFTDPLSHASANVYIFTYPLHHFTLELPDIHADLGTTIFQQQQLVSSFPVPFPIEPLAIHINGLTLLPESPLPFPRLGTFQVDATPFCRTCQDATQYEIADVGTVRVSFRQGGTFGVQPAAAPIVEPSTAALLALPMAGLAWRYRKRHRKSAAPSTHGEPPMI